MSQEFTLHGFRYHVEDDILYLSFDPHTELNLEVGQAAIAKLREILGDKKYLFFNDIGNLKSATRDSRAFFATEVGVYNYKAMAILAPSAVTRVIGNFFIGVNKPLVPTKLFSSKEEAIAWLRRFAE